MQRLICTELGDPRRLTLIEEPTPEPGRGEVLITTEFVGASFVDGLIVRGSYQVTPDLPFTPGSCVTGTITSVGAGVSEALLGERAATVLSSLDGAYASHVIARADAVCPIPDEVSTEIAASSMESYLTLTFAVTHRVPIRVGDNVVVLGAGGGIGLAAVDVARSLGATVTAVASSQAKRTLAIAAGATAAIGYEDLKSAIRVATGGGADVVIDPVGGTPAHQAIRALAAGGRYCVLGFATGQIPEFAANVILLRNRTVIGVDWGDWSREVGGAVGNARLLSDVFAKIAAGDLRPPEPTVAPLREAGEILHMFGHRQSVGRYVLRP